MFVVELYAIVPETRPSGPLTVKLEDVIVVGSIAREKVAEMTLERGAYAV